MTEKRRSSAEIQKELDAVKQRASDLEVAIRKTEESLKAMNYERDKLTGGAWRRPGDGKIAHLMSDLTEAERNEADEKAIRIVWNDGKSRFSSRFGDSFVLIKVTAKQIRIRPMGCDRTDLYALDGSSLSSYKTQIDIRKTFNIDSDSVPPNWKPETKNPPEES